MRILQYFLLACWNLAVVFGQNETIGDNETALFIPSPFIEMDENFVRLSWQAADLSASVMRETTNLDYPNATIFVDEPDKAMVVKIDDICFAAFRGTLLSSAKDILQNLDYRIADDVCYNGDCCRTRQGYRDAYLNVSYYDDFESVLNTCVASCCEDPSILGSDNCTAGTANTCEVVFTGYSQGGAAAQVAGIIRRDLEPTVITFGQPTTTQLPCKPVNTERYFRFINTVIVDSQLKYDPVPYVEFAGTLNYGRAFVVGEDSVGVATYVGPNGPNAAFNDWLLPNFLAVHDENLYAQRLEDMLDIGLFPLPIDGFESGHPCTFDSECALPDKCPQGFCTDTVIPEFDNAPVSGSVGDPCVTDADCLPTNTCDGLLRRICQLRKPAGSPCNEGSDCLSGSCNLFLISGICL